ncbi:major facilitator superfamily domain-containing protein [Aspergillus floccosus]
MADRIGRKKVAIMSMCGLLMEETAVRLIYWYSDYIPPRAVWFTPLFQLYGGGSQVATSMVYTIIADMYSVEKRANIFFIVSAAVLLAEILAAPLSAWMMTRSLWAPFLLGEFCEVCGLLAGLVIPETLQSTIDGGDEEEANDASDAPENSPSTWKDRVQHAWVQLAHWTTYIWGSRNSLAISVAFLTASVGQQSLQLMLQYVSKRFSWSMAEASFLISLKGCINLVGLLVLLPLVSRWLRRYLSPVTMDLRLTQASGAILVCGFAIMALAARPAVFALGVSLSALGWGFYSTLRSVASALVDESQSGILNTTIGLMQGVGIMTAGPLLASAFRCGMSLEGVWLGLPYMVGTALFLIAGWATWVIRVG